MKEKLKRIDFIGALMIVLTIVSLLLPLSIGGNQLPWKHPIILGLLMAAMVLGVVTAYVETKLAVEPMFPLQLLSRASVAFPYSILFFQNLAQTFVSKTARW